MIVTRTRTTKINILGVSKGPFSLYTETWRRIRAMMKSKLNTCWLCHKRFEDGQDIHLLLTSKGNKVVCATCAKDTDDKLGDENVWKDAWKGKDAG